MATNFNVSITESGTAADTESETFAAIASTAELPGAGTGDPFWNLVTLYMTGEDLLDHSSYARTITVNGSVPASTTQHFGTGSTKSLDFSAGSASNYLTGVAAIMPINTAADFCIEAWGYATAKPSGVNPVIVSDFATSTGACAELQCADGTAVLAQSRVSTNNTTTSAATMQSPNGGGINTWNHFTLARKGTQLNSSINGVWGTNQTLVPALSNTTGTPMNIGRNPDGVWPWKGYLSHIRITVGNSRYTPGTNFTPQIPPYPTSQAPVAADTEAVAGLDYVAVSIDTGFNPASLFANGEAGGFWDLSDPNSLFSNSGCTAPAVSGGPVLGIKAKVGTANFVGVNTGNLMDVTGGVTSVKFNGGNGLTFGTSLNFDTSVSHAWSQYGIGEATLATGNQYIAEHDASGTRFTQSMLLAAGTLYGLTFSSTGGNDSPGTSTPLGTIAANQSAVVAVERTSTALNLYIGGVLKATLAETSNPASFPAGMAGGLGCGYAGTSTPSQRILTGKIRAYLIINRILTSDEKINLNNWMAARTIPPGPLALADSESEIVITYSAVQSETDTVAESESAVTSGSFAGAQTEAGTAVDTESATSNGPATDNETLVATDINVSAPGLVAIELETGMSIDTPTGQLDSIAELDDTGTIADLSLIGGLGAFEVEVLDAEDTIIGVHSLPVRVVEESAPLTDLATTPPFVPGIAGLVDILDAEDFPFDSIMQSVQHTEEMGNAIESESSAGITGYGAETDEVLTAADVTTGALIVFLLANRNESASAVDTENSSPPGSNADMSEFAFSLIDVETGTLTAFQAITEAGIAADAESALFGGLPADVETLAAVDHVDVGVQNLNRSIVELLSPVDTDVVGAGAGIRSVQEILSLIDAAVGQTAFAVSRIESLTAVDTSNRVREGNLQVTDALSIVDTITVPSTSKMASRIEGLSAAEVAAVSFLIARAQAEAGTAVDTESAVQTTNHPAVVAEVANAVDQPVGLIPYSGDAEDTLRAQDTGRLLDVSGFILGNPEHTLVEYRRRVWVINKPTRK